MFKNKKNNDENNEGAFVKVLGSGCRNCKALEENVKAAMSLLNMEPTVGHITNIEDIVSYGVMLTPALVFGKEVVSTGKVLSKEEIITLIDKNRRLFQ